MSLYTPLRFLYNNYITSHTMLTPSTQATGFTSGSAKDGTGVATMEISGSFGGAFDLTYLLEIDSVSGGKEVGQATFSWRNSNTTGSWEETGVLTRTTPAYALSADGLNTNLSVSHTGRTGNDFELGDSWQWQALATYGSERTLDRSRVTVLRSTGTSLNIVIDLGSAKTPTAALFHDHNLTSSATVTLEGNSSDSWGSPAFTYTFSTITEALIYYFTTTETYQYWRWVISDSSNPDGYIEVANLFLGTYLQLLKVNAEWGSSEINGAVIQSNSSEAGILRRYHYTSQQSLSLTFGNTVKNDDITSLLAMQESLIDSNTKRVLPVWVHLFYQVPDTLKLMDWTNFAEFNRTYFSYLLNSGVALEFAEVTKV